jgi:CDP-paratose 2-epimerase
MRDAPVVIYGDGKQLRDVLYVTDLIEAFDLAVDRIHVTSGQAYNIGGGPENTLSLLELIAQLESYFGRRMHYRFGDWRPGDQLVYVSDVSKARADFGWSPRTAAVAGVTQLVGWLEENRVLVSQTSGPTTAATAMTGN